MPAWYLGIIMLVSILFSVVIYTGINSELQRIEGMQLRFQDDLEEGIILPQNVRIERTLRADPDVIKAARARLLTILGLINLSILGMSGGAGYFLAGRTLTPIKRMVEEQKRFIADSSHELRTPLTSLRTELEVALRNTGLNLSDTKKLLESNLEEVLNLQLLSDNLLELAHNDTPIKKDASIVSLAKITKASIRKVESMAAKKRITITDTVGDEQIRGVEERLVECFVIFLDNAIKYSPKESKIKISSKQNKDSIVVRIQDKGIGISKQNLPKIFDRFFRADASRSKNEGYGLGLSIAKSILDSHSATATVDSTLGRGTTFKLSFRNDF
jgi:signal transduction histidine kinase